MTVHLPSAVQSLKFTPKHLSALTINIRMYEAERNIYRSLDENAAKIGLWFKLTSVAHCDDEFEHDVSYTLSPSLEHHRFDLGFRKMVSALELTHYEVFEPLIVKLVTIWPQRAVAPKHAKPRNEPQTSLRARERKRPSGLPSSCRCSAQTKPASSSWACSVAGAHRCAVSMILSLQTLTSNCARKPQSLWRSRAPAAD